MDKTAESRTCNFCSNDFSSLDKKFNEQRIKNLPLEERPREKLLQRGVQALTDAELLAILLRTGTAKKSALDLGRELVADDGLYRRLARTSDLNELMQIKGLGQAKAATVLAALELGRRIASARPLDKVHVRCPQDVADFLMPRLRYATREQFLVILLNSKNLIIGTEIVSEGTLTNSVVHPREVFQPPILQHAAAICVAHNHPSGLAAASNADLLATQAIILALGQVGIDVLDHVILTPTDWFSMAEHGRVPQYNPGTGQLLFAARATWPMEPEKPKQIKR